MRAGINQMCPDPPHPHMQDISVCSDKHSFTFSSPSARSSYHLECAGLRALCWNNSIRFRQSQIDKILRHSVRCLATQIERAMTVAIPCQQHSRWKLLLYSNSLQIRRLWVVIRVHHQDRWCFLDHVRVISVGRILCWIHPAQALRARIIAFADSTGVGCVTGCQLNLVLNVVDVS